MQSRAASSTPRRRYDASGRQAEAESRRRRVTEAAGALFLDRGYAATSVADISDLAGVSPQMIYAAFGGKAGVLGRVVDVSAGGDEEEEVLLRERPESLAVESMVEPAARLRAMARRSADLNQRVGPILAVVDSASGADESVGELRERLDEAMRTDSLAVARRALGDLRPGLTVQEVADVLRTVAGHRTWHSLVLDAGWTPERYATWLEDALVRLLLD
jgi:AcrR family transcriptional regulator